MQLALATLSVKDPLAMLLCVCVWITTQLTAAAPVTAFGHSSLGRQVQENSSNRPATAGGRCSSTLLLLLIVGDRVCVINLVLISERRYSSQQEAAMQTPINSC